MPVSYQLWNNYLIKNVNYYITETVRINGKGKKWLKSIITKVWSAKNNIQPQSLTKNSCVIMLTNIIIASDWINVPCDEKLPTAIICQKKIKQRNGNKTEVYQILKNGKVEMCKNSQLPLGNRCVLFQKYKRYTNVSKLKQRAQYDNLVVNKKTELVLFGYFTIIQHHYLQPLQFIIPVNLSRRYIIFRPIQTQYFFKVSWISQESNDNDTQSDYDGYKLLWEPISKIQIYSTLIQCKDGSYIDEISRCDKVNDCFDGIDEKSCYCDAEYNNANFNCKFVCHKTEHCVCSDLYFTCQSNFTCIPFLKVCDGYSDCMKGEDEYCKTNASIENKTNATSNTKFHCNKSNTIISADLENDLIPDCPNSFEDEMKYHNSLTSKTYNFTFFCKASDELPCVAGHSICFPLNKLCLYDLQHNTRHLRYCKNGAHLYNCTDFQCPSYFKCPSSYCVPFNLICDGKWDCPEGHDELRCAYLACPNLFRCKLQNKCLHISKLCDKSRDCTHGDDELSCYNHIGLMCPTECNCFAQSVICHHLDKGITRMLIANIKHLKCYTCNIKFDKLSPETLNTIQILNMKKIKSSYFCVTKDKYKRTLSSLRQLDISLNSFTIIRSYCLVSLKRVATIFFQQNSLSTLEDNSFHSVLSLRVLDLSHNRITTLKSKIFSELEHLCVLNLTHNNLLFISAKAFQNIRFESIYSTSLKICCIIESWSKCREKDHTYSNCDEMLSNRFMRYICCILGIISIFLNLSAFVVQQNILELKSQNNSFITQSLITVDLPVGIYLVVIIAADFYYNENYIGYELSWRSNVVCKMSSLLALVSMLTSPIIISLMMVTRFCIVQWPLTSKFLKKRFLKKVVTIIIVLSFTISSFPTIIYYFVLGNSAPTGICLLYYTSKEQSFILLSTSLVIVLVQIICLSLIFILAILLLRKLSNPENMASVPKRKEKKRNISVLVICLIFTNLCCWIPYSVIFILSITGHVVPNRILTWITVGVIPINSALDPIFFTFVTPGVRRQYSRLASYVGSFRLSEALNG